MKCFDCAGLRRNVDPVAVCIGCGAAVCPDHAHVMPYWLTRTAVINRTVTVESQVAITGDRRHDRSCPTAWRYHRRGGGLGCVGDADVSAARTRPLMIPFQRTMTPWASQAFSLEISIRGWRFDRCTRVHGGCVRTGLILRSSSSAMWRTATYRGVVDLPGFGPSPCDSRRCSQIRSQVRSAAPARRVGRSRKTLPDAIREQASE